MASGTPVVLADNSAMTEVAGSGGYLQQGWDQTEWINTIVRASNELTTEDALKQAALYSWPAQIKNVLEVLEQY